MPRPLWSTRVLAILVSASLLPVSGCTTAERRASQFSNQLSPGMSEEEVQRALGTPDRVTATAEGTAWHYTYGPRPNPARAALGSAQAVGLVVIVVAQIACVAALLAFSRGGTGGGNDAVSFWTPDWHLPEVSTARVQFRVLFDRKGRVVGVSGLEAGGTDP